MKSMTWVGFAIAVLFIVIIALVIYGLLQISPYAPAAGVIVLVLTGLFQRRKAKRDWLERVKKLRSEGSFEKTMAYLNDVLKERPEDGAVYYQVAWTHDALGKESDAAPAYEKAIALGLSGEDLEGAYLGLGSTYRCLGDYENSERVLKKAVALFPENGAMKTFYALTLHNLKNYSGAMELLLKELIRTSADKKIKSYSRALLHYSDKLDQTFE